MKIVKRISRMYLLAELPLWNKKTKKYDIYPGDLLVIPDETHRNHNDMWWWDRLDRQAWYLKYGSIFDKLK